jgi:hypothetical protein
MNDRQIFEESCLTENLKLKQLRKNSKAFENQQEKNRDNRK